MILCDYGHTIKINLKPEVDILSGNIENVNKLPTWYYEIYPKKEKQISLA